MATKFSIFRRESAGGYSTRGPVVPEMSLEQARKEITRLKTQYPYQKFVIMGEIGEATQSVRVTVKIAAPDISSCVRKRRKQPSFDQNVIPLRQPEGA